MGAERQYTFMQMTREVEFQGTFDDEFTACFNFKNMELSQDTYNGISMELNYYLKVEMVYQGNLMKYTMEAVKSFIVRNHREDVIAHELEYKNENKNNSNNQINYDLIEQFKPNVTIEYEAYKTGNSAKRDLLMQLAIDSTYLNLDRDCVGGWIKVKDMSPDAYEHTIGVKL